MAVFNVFSFVKMHGALIEGNNLASQEVWKFRGKFECDDPYHAIESVAEVDSLKNAPNTEIEYAACRVDCWERATIKFTVKPERTQALDESPDRV